MLRVERHRRMLSIPEDNLAHTFSAHFSHAFVRLVNNAKLNLAMTRTVGAARARVWGWKDVVTLARTVDGDPTLTGESQLPAITTNKLTLPISNPFASQAPKPVVSH